MKISTLIEFNKVLSPHKARLVRGPSGIGKSSIIKQIAESCGAKVINISLPEMEPTDLVGLPYLSDKNEYKVTKYAQPDWWPEDNEQLTFLVMDEIDRASEDMQPIAMQLCLDRRAGGRFLPDNVIVWAACNGERYMTSPMDQALIDRFAVIDLKPTVDEWIKWAKSNDVNCSVLEFISRERGRLDTPDRLVGVANIVCPSRRSWAEMGFMINNIKIPLKGVKDLSAYCSSFIGHVDAEAFSQWINKAYKALTVEDIMNNKVSSKDLSILQVASIIDAVAEEFVSKSTSKVSQENCLNFFMSAHGEVFAAFFSALPADAGVIIEAFPKADNFFNGKKWALLNAQ